MSESAKKSGAVEQAGAAPAAAAAPAPPAPVVPADFEPRIVALCCHYCAYAAADLAGGLRLSYPPGVTIVRLPCSGRATPLFILEALLDGADGVLIAGCREGDCHFLTGNLEAKRRVAFAKKLLAEAGVEPERVAMVNLSSAEGARFAELARETSEKVRRLGPNKAKRARAAGAAG